MHLNNIMRATSGFIAGGLGGLVLLFADGRDLRLSNEEVANNAYHQASKAVTAINDDSVTLITPQMGLSENRTDKDISSLNLSKREPEIAASGRPSQEEGQVLSKLQDRPGENIQNLSDPEDPQTIRGTLKRVAVGNAYLADEI